MSGLAGPPPKRYLTLDRITNRPARIGLAAVLLLYLLAAAVFSQVLHFSRALDEGYHLEYITFIKTAGRLPISYEERAGITRADFPPLYHLLVAAVSAPVPAGGPPAIKLFWDSFRYRAMDHQAGEVWDIYTEDFQPPYAGRFLVWQIGRWTSILLSLGTLLVVFLTLRELPLFPSAGLALAGAASLAFIPRYIILGSALNDDNLLGLLAALYFLLLVKAIKQPQARWPFAAMGLLLGLSLTVKYTLVLAPLEVVLVCLWLARRYGYGWGWAGRRCGLVLGLALLASSWWFGWNLWFLNTVAQDGLPAGLLRPLLAGGSDTTLNRLGGLASSGQVGLTRLPEDTNIGTFPEWLRETFVSFWGFGPAGAGPLSGPAYVLAGLLLGVAAVGLWRGWRRASESQRLWLGLLLFHTGLFVVLPLVRFGLTRRLSVAAQGRHILIPAAAAIAGLLVWGLVRAVPPRRQRLALGLVVAGLAAWSGAHLYHLAADTSRPPLPLRTLPQAAGWLAHPVQVKFGEAIELAGYELRPLAGQGQLRLDLAWRCLATVNESYQLRLDLLDGQGRVVSYWQGYHGHGRVPTLAWEPGDVVFDRLALPLPNLPAGDYRLRLQLLGVAGPVAVTAGAAGEGETGVDLAPVHLPQPSSLVFTRRLPLNEPALDFSLWRADGPVEANLPVYRYPATISVVVSPTAGFDPAEWPLALVDGDGQRRPAVGSAAGIYTFIIGPDWASGPYRLAVGESAGEPLLAVENWWPRRFTPPEIAAPLAANFANQVQLLGYKLPQAQVTAGQAFPLTLYWQAPAGRSPQADFIQFNHLLDGQGRLWGGYDRRPLEYYSSLLWAPGEVVVDGYAVPVDPNAPPGDYYLDVGFYLVVGQSAVNLPLVVDGQMSETTGVTIGPVRVVAP